MRIIHGVAALLVAVLLTASPAPAKPSDIPGWAEARWGMTAAELDRSFGQHLRHLSTPLQFKDTFANRLMDGVRIGGERFTAIFQMETRTGRLAQILLRFASGNPAYANYAHVRTALVEELGKPARIERETDDKSDLPWFRVLDRWVLPTTTVVLTYLDPNFDSTRDKSLTVRYFPSRPEKPTSCRTIPCPKS